MTQIRLDHVHDAAFEQGEIVPLGIETFTRGKIRICPRRAHMDERFDVVGLGGFLEEEQAVRLQGADQADGRSGPSASVIVDHNVHVGADGGAQLADAFAEGGDAFVFGQERVALPCARLHRGETVLDVALGVFEDALRLVDAHVGVEADAIARGATEQFVDGHAPRLAAQIPQRLIQPGQRRVEDNPTAPKAVAKQDLPVSLSGERIFADQCLAELCNCGADRLFVVFQRRFTPTVEAAVGHHLNDDPIAQPGPHDGGADLGDFHSWRLPLVD